MCRLANKIRKQITFVTQHSRKVKEINYLLYYGTHKSSFCPSNIKCPYARQNADKSFRLLMVELLITLLLLLLLGVHNVGTAYAVEDEREKAERES